MPLYNPLPAHPEPGHAQEFIALDMSQTGKVRRVVDPVIANPATYIVLGAAIWLLDTVTVPFLMFPVLFVIPVTLCAWFSSRKVAYALAILLPIGRFLTAVFAQTLIPPHYAEANALIRIGVFLFLAYFVSRSARQTKELKREVTQLHSILPVCAACKRIRDDEGKWEPIDEYVTEHTDSVVSHGICPECARRLYGDLLDRQKGESVSAASPLKGS